jgi:hypothetical protein
MINDLDETYTCCACMLVRVRFQVCTEEVVKAAYYINRPVARTEELWSHLPVSSNQERTQMQHNDNTHISVRVCQRIY